MDYLWAPWRMPYIMDDNDHTACLFCELPQTSDGPDNLILHRGQHAYVMLNRYPYTSGHSMVVPYAHVDSLAELSAAEHAELMSLTSASIENLRRAYQAEAFNVGLNIGAAAGAGIVNHIHFHIVPRWTGDTNFMTAAAATRVLPEALEQTYERLAATWHAGAGLKPTQEPE
jgi:ATP adenylyltransferase